MNQNLEKTKEELEKQLEKAQKDLDVVSQELEKEVQERLAQKRAVEIQLQNEERRLAKIARQNSILMQVRKNMKYFQDKVGDLIYEPEFIWFMISVIFYTTDTARQRPGENPFFENLLEAYLREKETVKNASKNHRNKA